MCPYKILILKKLDFSFADEIFDQNLTTLSKIMTLIRNLAILTKDKNFRSKNFILADRLESDKKIVHSKLGLKNSQLSLGELEKRGANLICSVYAR